MKITGYFRNISAVRCAAVLTVLCICTFASGCVKFDRPALDRKYYTLDVKRDKKESSKQVCKANLIVRRINVSPRYEDRDLVYKVDQSSFESDYYNSFFISPSDLITQELRLWLSDSGMYANILGPESLGTGDMVLEGVVNSIYGDYTSEGKAVLNMQFFLIDNSSPDLPIIYSRSFSREVPVKGADAKSLVAAMNKGLRGIFAELEADILKTLENRK